MNAVLAFLLLSFTEGLTVVSPAYPPNAFSGGTVVAMLRVSSGSVQRVDIIQGDQPFVDPVRSALASWRFRDAGANSALVVVDFRTPNMYATGSTSRDLSLSRPAAASVFPTRVVEPAYPPNSLGEGSVVLRLSINEAGSVTKTEVVQGLGNLTEACVAAAKNWKFSFRRGTQGAAPASSDAFAVFVIRRPVLQQ